MITSLISKKYSLLLLSALALQGCSSKSVYKITLENATDVPRTDELVVLNRDFLEKKLGKISDSQTYEITFNTNTIICQLDDLNGDGNWDEAVFPLTIGAHKRIEADIHPVSKQALKGITSKAHSRLKKKQANGTYGEVLKSETMPENLTANNFTTNPIPLYQTEGPAWENDKVAFRSYFDVRNAKDIFGKTTAAMVMDTVGYSGDKYYHHIAPWGMDILKVGQSLGAGALAISLKNAEGVDTLIRVAGNNVKKSNYQLITNGPYRSIIRLTYQQVNIANQVYNISEEISIWGGQYFYQNKIFLEKTYGNEHVVTGIVNMHSNQSVCFDVENTNCMYTLDKQSENKDMLGMAVMTKKDELDYFHHTPKEGEGIINTYTAFLKPNKNNACTYRFYAAWEQSDRQFADKAYVDSFLKEEGFKWSHPLTVK
ncbi:DUF4861 domain-containing protein [Solitalea longa]|uniref:DUF4861 domain-containing protein n=1 Tax=Solitalea longa TaxID=2079460 RepID=A0A2S4ZZW8_9SPHI|nr:DUF4861 domain-containing protein [Solitalea longa]POY35845.1 DUF4861 domain-containing protein [Solitalea longa]